MILAQMDWETVWTVVGAVVGGYAVLAATVWRMHSRRVDDIGAKIDHQTEVLTDFRVNAEKEFVNKEECRDFREALRQ